MLLRIVVCLIIVVVVSLPQSDAGKGETDGNLVAKIGQLTEKVEKLTTKMAELSATSVKMTLIAEIAKLRTWRATEDSKCQVETFNKGGRGKYDCELLRNAMDDQIKELEEHLRQLGPQKK